MKKSSEIFAQRLQARRLRLGLQGNFIAEKLGVSESSVSSWLKGEVPKLTNLRRLAELLACRPEWLVGSDEAEAEDGGMRDGQAPYRYTSTPKNHGGPYWGTSNKAPILSWASAGQGHAFEDQGGNGPHIATDCKDANCYALSVDGDSMMPVYLPGDVLVCEPNSQAQYGDLVVCKTNKDLVLFKRLEYTDARKLFRLISFNQNYPPIEIKPQEITFIHPVFSVTRFRHKPRI